jgi:hypothetical protein
MRSNTEIQTTSRVKKSKQFHNSSTTIYETGNSRRNQQNKMRPVVIDEDEDDEDEVIDGDDDVPTRTLPLLGQKRKSSVISTKLSSVRKTMKSLLQGKSLHFIVVLYHWD